MSAVIGWIGGSNDERWEAAERWDAAQARAERLAERVVEGVPWRHNGCAACEGRGYEVTARNATTTWTQACPVCKGVPR